VKANYTQFSWWKLKVKESSGSSAELYLTYYANIYFNALLHYLEGQMTMSAHNRMIKLRWLVVLARVEDTVLMNCLRRYTRVTFNLTVQCLKPWVLKWKKFLRVDWWVLSNPGVIIYCFEYCLLCKARAVLSFKDCRIEITAEVNLKGID
jgi:hypothetical protein